MAVHIVAIQPLGTKECDHACAIGSHRAIGVSGFGVALLPGHALPRRFFPQKFPGVFVQAKDFPLLHVVVLGRCRVSVKSYFECRALALVDCSRDEQSVAPNNGTRVAQAGNRRFP